MPKNYYVILGIPSDSSQQEIKAAYRRLAKEYHPDRYGENNAHFHFIQEAYAVLGDPVRRRTYDSTLHNNRILRKQSEIAEPTRAYARSKIEPLIPEQPGPVHLGDASLFGSFDVYRPSVDNFFDRLFSNFTDRYPLGERPEDLTLVVTLTPEQAFRGGQMRFYVPVKRVCPRCYGRGIVGFYECWRCRGNGALIEEHPIVISHPLGMADNYKVLLSLAPIGINNLYLKVTFRISEMV